MADTPRRDPINPTTDAVREEVRALIGKASYGALAATEPETGHPAVSRIGIAILDDGTPVTLISGLSAHTAALKADPRCSLLLGEPGKGDPLAYPRVSLFCRAAKVEAGSEAEKQVRACYLGQHPKAELYAGFADFGFFQFDIERALYNGGFGRAYKLTREDLVTASDKPG